MRLFRPASFVSIIIIARVSLAATVLRVSTRREQIEFMLVREDTLSRMSHLRFQRCTCAVSPKTFACVLPYPGETCITTNGRTTHRLVAFYRFDDSSSAMCVPLVNCVLFVCDRLEAECPWVREIGHRLNGQQPLLYRTRTSPQRPGESSLFLL